VAVMRGGRLLALLGVVIASGRTLWRFQRRPPESKIPSAEDLQLLNVAHELRKYHHNALWEEEKHFTWIASILLSATVAIGATDKINSGGRFLSVLLLSIIGLSLCGLALAVVRRESRTFEEAAVRFLQQLNKCFPGDHRKIYFDGASPTRRIISRILSGQLTIRDAFQVVFHLFGIAFVILATVSAFLVGRWLGS
jgi:hypothetical protein